MTGPSTKRFVFEREDEPGEAWLARFKAGRAEAERWYRGERPSRLPTGAACRQALARHMPELLPRYDRACALLGDDEAGHRLISQFRPAPLEGGCTQAVWLGPGGPALIRNYDYPLDVVSDRFEATRWSGRTVIAKAQRPWGGCLDGMNDSGLVASLTAGGGAARGAGFSIILVLRYVLETCATVDEAVSALTRLPVAASQNVTVLDRSGRHATLFLGPDRLPAVRVSPACANHQEPERRPFTPAIAASIRRQQAAVEAIQDPAATIAGVVQRFLGPPLYSRSARSTTVYTAVYRPAEGRVDYHWPGKVVTQRLDRFSPGAYVHDYGALSA